MRCYVWTQNTDQPTHSMDIRGRTEGAFASAEAGRTSARLFGLIPWAVTAVRGLHVAARTKGCARTASNGCLNNGLKNHPKNHLVFEAQPGVRLTRFIYVRNCRYHRKPL